MCAHDPATAHRLHLPRKVGLSKAQPFQDSLRFRFNLMEIRGTLFAIGAAIFRRMAVNEGGSQLQDGFVSCRSAFLRKEPDVYTALQSYFPFVRFVQSQEDQEQSRLAGAIWPDQCDPIATIYLKRRVLQKNAASKRFRKPGDG